MYWEYSDSELKVLCEDCHAQEHADRELLQRLLDVGEDSGFGTSQIAGLLAGYLYGMCDLDPDLHAAALKADGHSFDLGVLVSIASGASWGKLGKAAAILSGPLTPPQENVLDRWKAPSL